MHLWDWGAMEVLKMNRNALKTVLLVIAFAIQTEASAQQKTSPEWVEFITPQANAVEEYVYEGIIPLSDSRRLDEMKTTKFNHTILAELRKQLSDKLQTEGISLASLQLVGYGAPAGNWKRNETRATARAVDLKAYLLDSEMGSGALNVGWVAEDWDSLLVLIESSNLTLRHAASDIIRNVDVARGRESELKVIGEGSFYRLMHKTLCPQLCRIEWRATLRREGGSTASGLLLIDGGRKTLTLGDMYLLAQRFEVGSTDFCNAVDLCERYFPDNDVAKLNAGAVALLRGDYVRAANLLKPYSSDARAYNNIGVLYRQTGFPEKAAVYLKLAAQNGSMAAQRILGK